MAQTLNEERLELITLNDATASFSRLFANTVRYHHWHQCLEVLYVEEGFGVVIVDHKQYTMRPGRMFSSLPLRCIKSSWMSRRRIVTGEPSFISTSMPC